MTGLTDDKFYSPSALLYKYSATEPAISEGHLKLHHQKHHQTYVNRSNVLYERLNKACEEKADINMKITFFLVNR